MIEELNKIEAYYTEGKKHWAINPEFVISRKFYEMWEKIHHPLPFMLTSTTFSILDLTFSVIKDNQLVGCFNWDVGEECCSLDIEGERTEQKILLVFEDGMPHIDEKPVVFTDIAELSFGERLEIIYDLIATAKKGQTNVDIKKLSRQEYTGLLNVVAFRYPLNSLKVMKQLTLQSVNKLISKASEDMAADEVSNQLVLPLDGHYAMSPECEGNALRGNSLMDESTVSFSTIKPRTRWAILRDLEFIKSAFESLVAYEEIYLLTFASCEVLENTTDNSYILKVPVNPEINVQEGEKLSVYLRGQKRPVARFSIDLFDGNFIIGDLSCLDEKDTIDLKANLFARPRKSPTAFLATLLNQLILTLGRDSAFSSSVLGKVIGIEDLIIENKSVSGSSSQGKLDYSQTCAMLNAVCPGNSIVVIQGPPGTGKTYVLEKVIRKLSGQHNRILMTAPSNTAVDNVCRRIFDLPVLRLGHEPASMAPDVRDTCWIKSPHVIEQFKIKRQNSGVVYCGTHVGILRDELINAEIEKDGLFDVIIFDEAGMTGFVEFILCVQLAERAILFGDHQQLPPFPLPQKILEDLNEKSPALRQQWSCLTKSALEWLIDQRGLSPYLLQASYRCQNPRLMRFSSTLFYNAQVKTSESADYYKLSFNDRQKKYPSSSLRLFRTSQLPLAVRKERLGFAGKRPGLDNPLEAKIAIHVFNELQQHYPLYEITIIAPYRRQVQLIRSCLSYEMVQPDGNGQITTESEWKRFLNTRISTVDSFQGGESDAVIICYVRSNEGNGIGFVDNPNRINVAHTRCRREMIIIGDLECLKNQSENTIFNRLERAVDRDGEIIDITEDWLEKYGIT